LLTELHTRVLDGDRTAIDSIAVSVLPLLRQRLQRSFPRAGDDVVHDAIEDAFMDYVTRPHTVGGCPSDTVATFLYRAAWRNVADLLERDSRRLRREVCYARETATHENVATADDRNSYREAQAKQRILDVALDAVERAALRLWLQGERRTEPLARALGLAGRSWSDQRREVKRFKDRVLKRILRNTFRKHCTAEVELPVWYRRTE
jgi:RNA polymerase sigma-70 factor (ECF subfamily)